MPICQGNQSPGGQPWCAQLLDKLVLLLADDDVGLVLELPCTLLQQGTLAHAAQPPVARRLRRLFFFSCKLPGTSAAPGMNTFYFEGGR